MLSIEEVAKHSTLEDIWVIVAGKAYDLSDFAKEHPGSFFFLNSTPLPLPCLPAACAITWPARYMCHALMIKRTDLETMMRPDE